jgi:hypothetical protein
MKYCEMVLQRRRRVARIGLTSLIVLNLMLIVFGFGNPAIAEHIVGTTGGVTGSTPGPATQNTGLPLHGGSANLSDALKPAPAGALSAIVGREIEIRVTRGTAPSKKMKAIHVSVQNKSDQPLVFEGGSSTLESMAKPGYAQSVIRCISQDRLDSLKRPPTTFKGKLVSDTKATLTAAASVGAVQTAEGILNEHGPILKRYEWDEERRENEESRFGKRLLYPGDLSAGEIYFPFDTSFEGMILKMPVKSFYDGSAQASVTKVLPFGG